MGYLYTHTHNYVEKINPNEILVEIGSDRHEGSTSYFSYIAKCNNTLLLTCDLDPKCEDRLKRNIGTWLHPYYKFYNEDGVQFAKNLSSYAPDKMIKVLYLDNYDWDWDVTVENENIERQKKWYAEHDITMNNLECQSVHLMQMINLMPMMTTNNPIICLDDTFEHNGVFTGKSGAVVPYLVANGYTILQNRDYGLILGK